MNRSNAILEGVDSVWVGWQHYRIFPHVYVGGAVHSEYNNRRSI